MSNGPLANWLSLARTWLHAIGVLSDSAIVPAEFAPLGSILPEMEPITLASIARLGTVGQGAQQTFFNTQHDIYVVLAPPFAMNWSVGQVRAFTPGKFPPEEPAGMVQSIGKVVAPRSLYLQQLRDRLGEQSVINVTTAEQRDGRIWNVLSARAGE
ncbi:hypothetical protein [Stenotrophomonas bentonitica]